jgi:hypothetical protein
MSQADFPEHYPFVLEASFLPCAPGLVCPDPGKMPENISFCTNSACFDLALEWYTLVNRTRTGPERLCTGCLSQCNPAKTAQFNSD